MFISKYNQQITKAKIQTKIVLRNFSNFNRNFCSQKQKTIFSYLIKAHKSLLIRENILDKNELQLQHNKIHNLKLAAKKIDGIVINPKETFSFWHLVGNPSKKQNRFLHGLYLNKTGLSQEIGGGLCQLSNLIYWITLHSPLEIIERHRHGFDFAPDFERTVPFGAGATVLYNYQDLRIYNPTNNVFQINISFDDKYIHGTLVAKKPLDYKYEILEEDHQIYSNPVDGKNYRCNKIMKTKVINNLIVESHELYRNDCEILYKIENPKTN